jgi:hypothetical protein
MPNFAMTSSDPGSPAMRKAVICLLLALAASPAAAKPDDGGKDPVVCRSAPVTGSRISSSECHLKSEWTEIDAARHRSYEEFNRQLGRGAGAERAPTNSPYPR